MSTAFRRTLIGGAAVRLDGAHVARRQDRRPARRDAPRQPAARVRHASGVVAVVHVADHEASRSRCGRTTGRRRGASRSSCCSAIRWCGGAALIGVDRRRRVAVAAEPLTSPQRFAIAFLGGAFALNFVPFMFISRVMYLYHYLFALVFAVLLAAYCARHRRAAGTTATSRSSISPRGVRRGSTGASSRSSSLSFAYFLPFSYGWAISQRAIRQPVLGVASASGPGSP